MRQAGSRRQLVSPFEKLFSLAVYRSIYISSRHCHVIKRIPISPKMFFTYFITTLCRKTLCETFLFRCKTVILYK